MAGTKLTAPFSGGTWVGALVGEVPVRVWDEPDEVVPLIEAPLVELGAMVLVELKDSTAVEVGSADEVTGGSEVKAPALLRAAHSSSDLPSAQQTVLWSISWAQK